MNIVEVSLVNNTSNVEEINNTVNVKLAKVKTIQLGLMSSWQTLEDVELDE